MLDVAVEKPDRVGAHLFGAALRIADVGSRGLARRVAEHIAEIGHGPRRMVAPVFGGNDVSHVGPGIEWLDEAGQGPRWYVPAQFLQIGAEPDLERLRGNGLDPLDHPAPAWIAGDDLAADVRQRADADAQHDEIEITHHLQLQRRALAAVPVRFEIPLLPPHLRAALQLPIVGLGGPAWHAA